MPPRVRRSAAASTSRRGRCRRGWSGGRCSRWQDAGHDYRNAANVAQRAAFVATNANFGLPGALGANRHVRIPGGVLERSGRYRHGRWGTLWLPGGVEPGGPGFRWRQVLPDVPGCHRFGEAGASGALPFPADPLAARTNKDGGYGWQLWRRYECCANPCRRRLAGPLRIALGG